MQFKCAPTTYVTENKEENYYASHLLHKISVLNSYLGCTYSRIFVRVVFWWGSDIFTVYAFFLNIYMNLYKSLLRSNCKYTQYVQ